jgi:hypothetical protein
MSTFFGLTPEYKLTLHKDIFNMVTYGKGGWDWDTIYNMPIFLRLYYMKLLAEALEREVGKSTQSQGPVVKRPNVIRG